MSGSAGNRFRLGYAIDFGYHASVDQVACMLSFNFHNVFKRVFPWPYPVFMFHIILFISLYNIVLYKWDTKNCINNNANPFWSSIILYP